MSGIGLTDRQWAFIRPSCHPQPLLGDRGRTTAGPPWGILYILITGCRWQDLPRKYGAPTTVWRRLKQWGEKGICERFWRAALT